MKNLREYMQKDELAEFDDEKVASNMYLTSLVKSLREIDGLQTDSKFYEECMEKNKWLISEIPSINGIYSISMDQLKNHVNKDMKSCDALIYNSACSNEELSILCEYKAVNKKAILQFIADSSDAGILAKVKDTLALIKTEIDFSGGYTGIDLINHLHLVLIYKQNDSISDAGFAKISKQSVIRDNMGRQIKAARNISFTSSSKDKCKEEKLDIFSRELSRLGLAETEDDYFGISKIDPEAKKKKGLGKRRQFSLISKDDLKIIVEEKKFFDNWKWGEYSSLFQ